jgi:glycosyltransferase involved in cell wall biosynthesis
MKPAPKLANLLVPGAGNLQQLAPRLHELGVLNLFVYSHRRSTTPESLGLPEGCALNLWPKEYLTRAHLKLLGWRYTEPMFPIYNAIWELSVLRHWRPAPVVHALLWGAARHVLERARREGSVTIGLIANSHPIQLRQLLAEEAERLRIPFERADDHRLVDAVLQEVASCDHLQAESEFTKRSYIAAGFPAERIHVVRPGKELSRFYPASEAEEQEALSGFRVLCVGAVSLRKGQVHLLEAWRRLHLPNAELTLIGGITADVAAIMRRYGDEFEHFGRVESLRPYFVRSSVLVVPSIEDGHAHVVGEALACGIPVIATVNTGAADYIRDGVNGYVVPIASPDAIAEKLAALHRDPTLLRALRDGARATIPTVGDWRDRARDFAALYRRIAPISAPATFDRAPAAAL